MSATGDIGLADMSEPDAGMCFDDCDVLKGEVFRKTTEGCCQPVD